MEVVIPTRWSEFLTCSGLLPNSSSSLSDLRLLASHCLSCEPAQLLLHADKLISKEQSDRLAGWVVRANQGEPIAYILGYTGFWSFDRVRVTSSVLIPRPDTECLVEVALNAIEKVLSPTILELGTGSGAVASALSVERPDATILATDVSEEALAVARENCETLGAGNIGLRHANWLNHPDIYTQKFNLILSNPPYIEEEDAHLENLQFEPKIALTSGMDGLDAIRHITTEAFENLLPKGALCFEHGWNQGLLAREIMRKQGYEAVATEQDLSGQDRVTWGVKP